MNPECLALQCACLKLLFDVHSVGLRLHLCCSVKSMYCVLVSMLICLRVQEPTDLLAVGDLPLRTQFQACAIGLLMYALYGCAHCSMSFVNCCSHDDWCIQVQCQQSWPAGS